MLKCDTNVLRPLWAGLLLAALAMPAAAFDINSGVTKESGPFDLFKFGFKSYKSGKKDDAVEAYRYAAEKGHTGSRWALANMYAYGDGVAKNDFEAFKIYSEIASQGVEPGSEDTASSSTPCCLWQITTAMEFPAARSRPISPRPANSIFRLPPPSVLPRHSLSLPR